MTAPPAVPSIAKWARPASGRRRSSIGWQRSSARAAPLLPVWRRPARALRSDHEWLAAAGGGGLLAAGGFVARVGETGARRRGRCRGRRPAIRVHRQRAGAWSVARPGVVDRLDGQLFGGHA